MVYLQKRQRREKGSGKGFGRRDQKFPVTKRGKPMDDKCFNYGRPGHFARDCPNKGKGGGSGGPVPTFCAHHEDGAPCFMQTQQPQEAKSSNQTGVETFTWGYGAASSYTTVNEKISPDIDDPLAFIKSEEPLIQEVTTSWAYPVTAEDTVPPWETGQPDVWHERGRKDPWEGSPERGMTASQPASAISYHNSLVLKVLRNLFNT